jgi:hypothetical protein
MRRKDTSTPHLVSIHLTHSTADLHSRHLGVYLNRRLFFLRSSLRLLILSHLHVLGTLNILFLIAMMFPESMIIPSLLSGRRLLRFHISGMDSVNNPSSGGDHMFTVKRSTRDLVQLSSLCITSTNLWRHASGTEHNLRKRLLI